MTYTFTILDVVLYVHVFQRNVTVLFMYLCIVYILHVNTLMKYMHSMIFPSMYILNMYCTCFEDTL